MERFEELLELNRCAVERFVRFRISSKVDSDDVLQDVYIAAYRNFHGLKNEDYFKSWIISIARNNCNDYYRKKSSLMEIHLEEISGRE